MTENQRLIKLIMLRRKAMLVALAVAVSLGVMMTVAVQVFDVPLSSEWLQASGVAMNLAAFASLAFMGMVLMAIRGMPWALAVTGVALFTVVIELYLVAVVGIIVVNRLASASLHKLRAVEAAKAKALEDGT